MFGTATGPGQAFTWSTTSGTASFNRHAEITAPNSGETVSGSVNFEAYLVDDDYDGVQWAVREGTCAAGTNTVFGNVDGHSDVAIIDTSDLSMQTFSFTGDMSAMTPGMYCFIYNPREDGDEPNIRLTREFTIADTTAPLVEISSPLDDAVLTGSVNLVGFVTDDVELSHYNLSLYPGNIDLSDGLTHSGNRLNDVNWCTTPTSGTVNLSANFSGDFCNDWDTTNYLDGDYQIRLAARDAAGNRDTSDPDNGNTSSVHVIQITIDNTPDDPADKDVCKKGGWEAFGFRNQGQCVRYIETGKDSR